jgi:replicative DNA helicase
MDGGRHLEAKEAETAVLGAVFLDPSAFDRVSEFITSPDFFSPRNQLIFEHMSELREEGEPIDTVTLAQALEQSSNLQNAGGMDYLISLDSASASTLNVEHHASIVHEMAEIRRLIATCADVMQQAHSGDYDHADKLFDEAQAAIFEVGARARKGSFVGMKDALRTVIEHVQAAFESKASVTGTGTGFIDLDRKTSGLQGGDLIVLAGRPGMGKTAFALNLASNAAIHSQVSVAIFSLEMPTRQLAQRLLACEARVDSERMRSGSLAEGDIDSLLHAVRTMNDWSVHIDDTPGASVMEVRSKCRRLASDKRLPPLGLVIIDYLQLMSGRGNNRSREQEISEMSRSLKSLAKELDVPIIALSQLNRGVESRPNKRPLMSDLRESGAIEQDADIIMFVYRDEYYDENSEDIGLCEVIIAKQRNGPIGTSKLKFFKEWSRFDNFMVDGA